MPTKIERLQNVWHKYDAERSHKPTSAREAVEWAVKEGLLHLPEVDPYDVLAGQMSQALREEYAEDDQGRRYRINHAVRVTKDDQGRRYRINHAVRVTKAGVQYTFWGMMGFASHEHMEKAFTQRREQIVGDNVQLKTDVDVYNDLVRGRHPAIQLVMDYTDDVAEREVMRKIPSKRAEAEVA